MIVRAVEKCFDLSDVSRGRGSVPRRVGAQRVGGCRRILEVYEPLAVCRAIPLSFLDLSRIACFEDDLDVKFDSLVSDYHPLG